MKKGFDTSIIPQGLLFRRVEPVSRNPPPPKKKKKTFVPNADLVGGTFNAIKWLMLAFCILACGYQCCEFLIVFLKYETVTVTEIKYTEFVDLPAITVCNRNGLKRTHFCRLYPDRCEKVKNVTEYCRYYGTVCKYQYSNVSEVLFPKDDEYPKEGKHPLQVYRSIGHHPSTLFEGCQYLSRSSYEKCRLETAKIYPTRDKQGNKKICYRINAENDASPITQPKMNMKQSFIQSKAVVKWFIDLEADEYFRPDRQPGALISIHSPYRFINPFIEGFSVEPATLYKITLTISEMNLLRSPYDTNCTDYLERWKDNNGRGPITQELCFDLCFIELTMKKCNCVSKSIQTPHDKRVCEIESEEICVRKTGYVECQDHCGQACHSIEYNLDIKNKPRTSLATSDDPKKRDWVEIEILFKREDITAYTYEPKYENIELLSYVGGFLSMWLGMSLYTLADITGAVFTIVKLLFRGKPKKRTPVFTISKMPIHKGTA